MSDILRTVEVLGEYRSKRETVPRKFSPFCDKTTKKKMILVMGVTARK